MRKLYAMVFCLAMFLLLTGCTGEKNVDDLYNVTRQEDHTYDYWVKDRQGNVLVSQTGSPKEPMINVIGEDMIRVSSQAGTGTGTQSTVYFNVDQGMSSQIFQAVLGEYQDKVIYVQWKDNRFCVVVQDIFDPSIFYRETLLEDVFAAADPVVGIKLDGDTAVITYLRGEDYTQTEISIDLT